jgi:hypothetical protein
MKVVLLVDQNPFWHEKLCEALCGQPFEILSAYSDVQARQIYVDRPDIDYIAVDDCISGRELDSMEFVVEIRRGFSGRIIACCSNCNNGDALVKVGCDAYTCKSHLGKELLGQQEFAVV